MEVICENCGTITRKKPSQIKNYNKHFCSRECYLKYVKSGTFQVVECKNCGTIFEKATKNVKKTSNNNFCCRSCAAIYNNRKYPKRRKNRKRYYCDVCGVEVPRQRKFCDKHYKNYKDWSIVMLKDIWRSKIASLARMSYKRSGRPEKCEICGYDKCYQVCHIKPIYMFNDDTLISVVNSLSNLIGLCPNCHWELDNGLIDLSVVRRITGFEPIQE